MKNQAEQKMEDRYARNIRANPHHYDVSSQEATMDWRRTIMSDKGQRPNPPRDLDKQNGGNHDEYAPPSHRLAADMPMSDLSPPANPVADLSKLAEDIQPRNPRIRKLVAALTYGEMMEMAQELGAHIPGGELQATTDKNIKELVIALLPSMLHKWATS